MSKVDDLREWALEFRETRDFSDDTRAEMLCLVAFEIANLVSDNEEKA